jgi:hypothetical protein
MLLEPRLRMKGEGVHGTYWKRTQFAPGYISVMEGKSDP